MEMKLASYLAPYDLLSLSEVCKDFKETLDHPNAVALWVVSEANVGIPKRPVHIRPKWLAYCLFGGCCQVSVVPVP